MIQLYLVLKWYQVLKSGRKKINWTGVFLEREKNKEGSTDYVFFLLKSRNHVMTCSFIVIIPLASVYSLK